MCRPEVESLRTSLASRKHFEVLGLEGQVLGLEASSPRKLPCPRLEDSTFFWIVEFCRSLEKNFGWRFLLENAWKKFLKTFFFWEHLRLCPWLRAFLSLASRGSVLGRAVLGLGFFLCPWPWPWPRALCPRLHLWCIGLCAFRTSKKEVSKTDCH